MNLPAIIILLLIVGVIARWIYKMIQVSRIEEEREE